MRKFRFIGDPEHYDWDNPPLVGNEYDGDHVGVMEEFSWKSMPLEGWCSEFPQDWQEVFEEPQVFNRVGFNEKPLHKDTDLGHYTLELLKIRMESRERPFSNFDEDVNDSIQKSKELIKQLDQETK